MDDSVMDEAVNVRTSTEPRLAQSVLMAPPRPTSLH